MSEDQKAARKAATEAELAKAQKEADEINKQRTGIGTRLRVGQTRGKNPVVITWEAFDESKIETLPKTVPQFQEVAGNPDEDVVVSYLISGLNEANYTAASDPLAEFVEDYWPQDAQTQFRLVVRNYSRGAQVSLEDAVGLIKPGFEKQFPKPAETEAVPA